MNYYFIKTDKGHYGPVAIELLRKLPIKRDTLLWNKSLNSWRKAEDIDELKVFFINTPPLLNTESPSTFKQAYLKNKLFGLLLAKFSKITFLLSISFTVAVAFFLWFRFQPNKFGDDDLNKINQYFNKQKNEYEILQRQQKREEDSLKRAAEEYRKQHPEEESAWEFFLKNGEKDPFANLGIVPTGPAASIPYEYVDGFWDYCSNANGKVFLDISNIVASFESRKTYLIERIIKISLFTFFASFLGIIGYLFYRNSLQLKLANEPTKASSSS